MSFSTQIIFILIFCNILIFFNFERISKLINIYDFPDKVRKFHKHPVPILGGAIIFFSLAIIFVSGYFFNDNYLLDLGFDKKNILIFSIFCLVVFLIYLFDDIKNLGPNHKLLLLSVLIIFYLNLDSTVVLTNLRFRFFKEIIFLNKFSLVFTLFSILLFINALNMFDGINLQCGTYSLFIFFMLFILAKKIAIFYFMIPLFFFLLLNYSNSCFLGNSGSALLSFIISVLSIKIYNFNNIYAEDIFLLMCIPGYDLLRLAFVRLLNKKHPFYPDRNHLHHLISDIYGHNVALFIILFLIIIINLVNFYSKFPSNLCIFLSIFLYSGIIFYAKKIRQ
jgi:UDP-N-acetylmuramyl pentapeptide phosphotransferase/UDP-N-acetylglucosamine-1-phosphate transferase